MYNLSLMLPAYEWYECMYTSTVELYSQIHASLLWRLTADWMVVKGMLSDWMVMKDMFSDWIVVKGMLSDWMVVKDMLSDWMVVKVMLCD